MDELLIFKLRSDETGEEIETRYQKEYAEFCKGRTPLHGRDLPFPFKEEIIDGKTVKTREIYIYRAFY